MKINESFGPIVIAIQGFAILAFVTASIFSHGAVVRILAASFLLTTSFCLRPNLLMDTDERRCRELSRLQN